MATQRKSGTIGQARGIGTSVAAQRGCNVANRIKLNFLHKRIESVLETHLRNMQGVLSTTLSAAVAPGVFFRRLRKIHP